MLRLVEEDERNALFWVILRRDSLTLRLTDCNIIVLRLFLLLLLFLVHVARRSFVHNMQQHTQRGKIYLN